MLRGRRSVGKGFIYKGRQHQWLLSEGFQRELAVFLEVYVAVAFGAEVLCGGATEEAAVVDAELGAFWLLAASALLISIPALLVHPEKEG